MYFSTLLVSVSGSSATNSTKRGTMKLLMLSRQCSTRASGVRAWPSCSTIEAATSSSVNSERTG
ncbi:Uncharacterised protein [Bordetella pertussis]|nr:Uncharacterised protein [Bordetella pertussis]